MKTRTELREIAMKVLYQVFMMDDATIKYEVDELINEQLEIENEFVNDLVNGVIKNKKELYNLANKYLKDWTMKRLSLVDQAIICIGIYELTKTKTPSIVVINEAVELSKSYSDEKVTSMINGILDSIYHEEEKDGR